MEQVHVATVKHGVVGFRRGYAQLIKAVGLPIRINTLMPPWTTTTTTTTNVLLNIEEFFKGTSHEAQPLWSLYALLLISWSISLDRET